MILLDLSVELLDQIVAFLDRQADLSCFARSCQFLFKLFINKLYIRDTVIGYSSVLRWASRQSQIDTLVRAKSAGLRISEPGLCLLSDVARYTKSLPMTRLLLECGVDVNESGCSRIDECLRAPLHYAVSDSCGDMVQLLLATGADPHLHDCRGLTALHMSREGNIVKLLLQAGAKINAPTTSGDFAGQAGVTPLAHQARQGNLSVVKVLLEAGADPWDVSLGAPLTTILMQDERTDVLICILDFQMSVPTDSRAPRLCTLCDMRLATANDWRTHAKSQSQ